MSAKVIYAGHLLLMKYCWYLCTAANLISRQLHRRAISCASWSMALPDHASVHWLGGAEAPVFEIHTI